MCGIFKQGREPSAREHLLTGHQGSEGPLIFFVGLRTCHFRSCLAFSVGGNLPARQDRKSPVRISGFFLWKR